MSLVHGRKFGMQLIEAFGIQDQHVSRLVIEADANEAAKVTITRFMTDEETRAVQEIVTEYELVTEVTDLESENREYRRAA